MPKRLTRLKIDSVDVVDRGAGRGVQVKLMKRNYATPTGYRWGGAYNWVRTEKQNVPAPVRFETYETDADRRAASVAAAKREITENMNTAAIGKAAPRLEDNMTDDIITTMSDRVAEIAKAAGCTTEAAMMRLAESRSLEDQELWREYKLNTAPAPTAIGKAVDPDKAARKMAKRADELVAAGVAPSRQAAIAKLAESRDPEDQKLWARYRQSGAVLDNNTGAPVS